MEKKNKPRKRRRTKAAKLAYARAAVVGFTMVLVVGVSVFAFTRFLENRPSAQPVTQLPSKPDAVASATYNPLTSGQLSSLLRIRVDQLYADASTALIPEVEAPVQQAPTTPATPSTDTPADTNSATTPSTPTPAQPVKFDPSTMGSSGFSNIASWKQKNSDVVGWLKIPNTNINYPVVVGPDNLYYGSLGYDKQYSKNGVIWADSDTKFGNRNQISQNNVIYGHNWTNYTANPAIARSSDVMFGQLTSFHHLDFAKQTPYIYYSTSEEEMVWQVFSVFYTEESFNYIVSDPGSAGLQNIIDEARLRSRHKYDVNVNSSDKILTLSTCTRAYGSTSQQRFVVMARLMQPGESITEVSITANPNHKQPRV